MFDEYFAMRSTLWALLVVLGACTKPNPASCLDDFCNDPALPFCDVDGSIGGTPDTCIAVVCTAGEFAGCRDDDALTCNETGTNLDVTACEFGCGADGCLPCNTSDCQPPETHIIPLYVPTVCNDLATTTLAVTEDITLDTSDVANCTSVVTQINGPEICVVHHETIDIVANKTLRYKGTRAIALVADRGLTVNGILDISASSTSFSGPGGGLFRSGTQGTAGGGGGAGFRTAGGNGGVANVDGGGANGGAAGSNPAESRILVGGTQALGTGNGAAGGAATLVCCRCTTSVVGSIDAGGGGGRKGAIGGQFATGGGSGGVVALQGLDVAVTGRLFANGGGGGAGGSGNFNDNTNGQDGTQTTACAPGGTGSGGAGGAGGCFFVPTDGKQGANNLGGGGGGSTGFFLTYTPAGITPVLTPIEASPALEPNGVIPTN